MANFSMIYCIIRDFRMKSLIQLPTSCRVSSVLNRDAKHFGKQFLLDNNEETCWNSDQGTPQWIELEFNRKVCIEQMKLMFQGGFAGKDCQLIAYRELNEVYLMPVYPEDKTNEQIFNIPYSNIIVTRVRVAFNSATDFYGRIIIYKLDILGEEAEE